MNTKMNNRKTNARHFVLGVARTYIIRAIWATGWLAAVLLLGYLLLMEATVGRAIRWLQRRRGGAA